MTTELQAHYRTAAIGEDAREFLDSELGKTIMQRAEAEIDALTRQLIDTNADDPKEVRRIQTEIHRRELSIQWFIEAYEAGQQSLHILENQQDD